MSIYYNIFIRLGVYILFLQYGYWGPLCLAEDIFLIAESAVASSITAQYHTFMKIEHEMISMAIFLPSTDLGRFVTSNKQKYVHKVLVNCLAKLVQGKLWLVK